MKYYIRESGTIVRCDDDMHIYYLNQNHEWINDQTLIDMFTDDFDYQELTEHDLIDYLKNE